ncbi:GntR family transcriptional regulator [Leekyejoonella antrihumi]|uniref:GntR family transcriptional regulator n=1 Tax=Leekyejoonella antrihumi TaxID=1660198 RepID=UPI0016478385|nr:GntR family transcriptional regulator [Leekyejoonella antrihumi]
MDLLVSRLVSGTIHPGAIYSAAALAGDLGISTGPVREAVLSLVQDGVLEVVKNRGYRVVTLSDTDLDEVYEMRCLLEVPAIGNVARRGLSVGELARCSDEIARMGDLVKRGDVNEFLITDKAFHLGIISLTGNSRLVKAVGKLRDESRLYGLDHLARTHELNAANAEHAGLVQAIASMDVESAQVNMQVHLRHTRGIWAARGEE